MTDKVRSTYNDWIDHHLVSPVVRSLCSNCGDKGRCCRNIKLSSGMDVPTKLEALIACATIYHTDPWMGNTGVPFIPDYRGSDGVWRLSCSNLMDDGTCGDYENRPKLCRDFIPGVQQPCAMTTWWEPPID